MERTGVSFVSENLDMLGNRFSIVFVGKNIPLIAYLIRKNTSQVEHRCYGNSCLMLSGKAFHDIFLGQCAFLCGRWLPHEGGGIRREAKCIHLREIDSCVLTRASKNDNCEQVDKLLNGFQ